MGDYPGLARWALHRTTNVLIKRNSKFYYRGSYNMKTRDLKTVHAGLKDGTMSQEIYKMQL